MADIELENIRYSLDNLENTSDSIVGTSSQFLNLEYEEAKLAVDIFFQKFKVVIETPLLKNKILNYIYIANDILQKSKNASKPFFQELFIDLKNSLNLVLKRVPDRILLKDVSKILRLWRDRGVYKKDVLDPVIKAYENTMNDLKNENKDSVPEISFNIEDIAAYVQAKKNLEKWNTKTQEAKETVENMIPKTDSSNIGDLEVILGDYNKSLELTHNYRQKVLKCQAELLKQIDVAHVKQVLELKKVLGTINDINAY